MCQVTTTEKDEVASAMVDFHLMAKVKCIMDQFMEGLNVFGLLDKIKQQPSVWEPLFVYSSALRLTEGSVPVVRIILSIIILVYAKLMVCRWLKNLI